MAIDWDNLYKVRIANSDDSFQKHEIIKLLIVMKILNKHRRRNWLRIYTKHKMNGMTADVYMENIKDKSIICYEIKKDFTKKWLKEKTEQYKSYEVPFMKSVNFIPINLNECSDNILELNKQLDKYIY